MPGRGHGAPLAQALLAGAVLLAGCDRPERVERRSAAASIAADYADCRERAGGDGRQLIACADAAVTAAAPDAAPAFAALGEAANASAGESIAHRVGVADALAGLALERALLREGVVLPDADERPVAPALAMAAEPIMAQTCSGARAAQACEQDRRRLLPRLAARLISLTTAAPGATPKAAPLGGYVPPTCEAVRAMAPDAALAVFESEFPAALRDERLVETIALSDEQLGDISAYLACLAALTKFAPDVIDGSLLFFGSRQSGARARAALEDRGRGTGSDAAAAREFASQVADYLAASEG